jgi:hypothetical protein
VRFKIDVSDRETGEVATLVMDAPDVRSARRELQRAGYMIWATQPLAASPHVETPKTAKRPLRLNRLREEAQHSTFRAHPVRFVIAPLCGWSAAVLLWLSVAAYFLHLDLPQFPHAFVPTAGTLSEAAVLCWIAGQWIGRPLAKGHTARRACADAQIVCRYCRKRGSVHTSRHGLLKRRLCGHCTCCGIRWAL